ncbi:hypothetical protein [Ornithinibacillus sp. JPR2-1]
MPRTFSKGEKYRPVVTVKKVKKNIPTVITVSGRRYVHEPEGKRK